MRCPPWLAIAALLATNLALTGCGRISTEYGSSKGITGRTSLNGFGALRSGFERAGFRSRDVSRMSDRVMLSDVIVWTPQVLGPIDTKVTNWFERWFKSGNKTLVYIVPDSGSEAAYWREAARLAPPEQRLEYRRRAARSINQRMAWRLNRTSIASNGWFGLEPQVHRQQLGSMKGPWAAGLLAQADPQAEISSEFSIVEFNPKANATATGATAAAASSGKTGPGSPGWIPPSTTTPTTTPIRFSTLLRTQSGTPVVAEIRSKRWGDSKVIVVAGGSLLTNYAFSRSFNRRLAERIIAESSFAEDPDPLAAFLTSSWAPVPVSEKKPGGVPTATGMELLTVWPLSLVTMHGVMLGFVICLMLLPIFGRPRRIQRTQENNFGHHLDAVAALMNKSGGEDYARARISEYFKRMHGETTGPWVIADPPTNTTTIVRPPLTSKRRLRPNPSTSEPESSDTAPRGDEPNRTSTHDEANR